MTAITIDDVKAPDIRMLLRYAPDDVREQYLGSSFYREFLDARGTRVRDQFLTGAADNVYPMKINDLRTEFIDLSFQTCTPETEARLREIKEDLRVADPDPQYPLGWNFSKWQANARARAVQRP